MVKKYLARVWKSLSGKRTDECVEFWTEQVANHGRPIGDAPENLRKQVAASVLGTPHFLWSTHMKPLPCPFCGRSADSQDFEDLPTPRAPWGGTRSYAVFCLDCEISVQSRNPTDTVKRWNRLRVVEDGV